MPIDRVAPDVAQQWSDLGVTLVPPTGFLQKVTLSGDVVNHSGGKVDDATARLWAEGLQRTLLWDQWAVENGQKGLLAHLGPVQGAVQRDVFGDDYTYLQRAKDSGGRITGQIATISRFTLVATPASVKTTLVDQHSYTAPIPDWGFVVSTAGPIRVILTTPDGKTTPLQDVPAAFRDQGLVIGDFKSFPGTLGDLWSLQTFLSCSRTDFVRAACSS